MARTYQRRGGTRTSSPRRPSSIRAVRLPKSSTKRRFPYGDLRAKIVRIVGIVFLCAVVAGVAFAAGAYFGLVRSVARLGEPRHVETHPTYIYSAPLAGGNGSRRVIGTIFQGENRRTVSKGQMPIHLLNALIAKEDERF